MIKAIADALHNLSNPKCHYSKDATVVAVVPYAQVNHYSATPLVMSVSCKCETVEALAQWISVVLETWSAHPFGVLSHGPIWAFAMDRDSVSCVAKHQLCMVQQVSTGTELGQQMQSLHGLSSETIFGTCDLKHVIKCR